jgi:hypothetical protein
MSILTKAPVYEKSYELFSYSSPYDSVISTLLIITIIAVLFFIISQLLKNKPKYFSQEYWESRYSVFSKEMDWYCDFKKLCNDFNIGKIILEKYPNLKKTKFLELGCGNSTLAHDLYVAGFKNITSIDFSHVVIDKMKKKYVDDDVKCKIYFD